MKKILYLIITLMTFISFSYAQPYIIHPHNQTVSGEIGALIEATVIISNNTSNPNLPAQQFYWSQCTNESGLIDVQASNGWALLTNQQTQIKFIFRKTSGTAHQTTYKFLLDQSQSCGSTNATITITVNYLTPTCNLATPSGLTSTVLSHTDTKLTWIKNASAASYELRYKKTTDLSYTFETFVCGTTCEKFLYNLTPSTSYIWSVKPICTNGVSTSYAPDRTFTTQACPTTAVPTNITATPYNGGFFITYTPVTDFYSCYVEYVDLTNNNTGTWGILQTSTPVNNFYAIPQTHDFKFRLFSTVCQRYTDWITVSGVQVSCTLTPPSTSTFNLVSMCGSSTPGSQCGVGQFSWGGVTGANRYEIQWNVFNLSGQSYSGSFQVPASQTNGSINGMGAPSSGGPWYATFRVRVRCTNNIWSDFSPLSNMFTW